MPARTPVVAYVHPGPDEKKQHRTLLKLCKERAYEIQSICDNPRACAQLVAAGVAAVVVAAFDHRVGLRHAVALAGGTVVFARARATHLPSLREWLGRATRRGASDHDIAQVTGDDTTDVTRLLRELGLRPPSED